MFVFVYLWIVPNSFKDTRRKHLPPGPPGLPIIGNLLDFSDSEAVRNKVIAWPRQYGDVFYTKLGGTDYIWLSTPQAVKDLMDKKSNIYSSRPPLPLAQDVASGGYRQLFMKYGLQWRQIRKHSHTLLNLNAAAKYQPIQDFESKQVLRDLIESPSEFYFINRRYSSSVTMLVTYGYRIPSFEHPLIKKIYTVLDNLTEMTAPGAHAVDSFPSLAMLPQWILGNWKSFGKRVFEHDSKIYMDLWEQLKHEVDNGEAKECFSKEFYKKDPAANGIDDKLAAYTCGGLVEAGSETTASTINNWFLAMTLNPEAQKRAQEEIDRVVGPSRLPEFSDEKDLPYVRAMVKETLRWRPVNKFGMMHTLTEDDWYNGYFLPKGSTVVLNWWAIHFNPEFYPDPEKYDPARFLDKPLSAAEYINSAIPNERDHFTYGAGRRVCPGVHVAERSLFINIVRVLWAFNIKKVRDLKGNPIEPNIKMVRGFLSVPELFHCDIKPRSPEHAHIIMDQFVQAEKDGIGA
ncbi:cytochrome P450 [Plenodomus tracheiphilus IPT5]|uniref:Cytochrome P450 n=1 Tax=Plenodomus tracheiphilus IPT5 TaxID=1408161 RepID=A0A6A7B7V1_9PLEO|nr:cytochrome P450 [Plenodomus tracheiphilus IPT5]